MEIENKEVCFEVVVEKVVEAATLFNRITSGGLSLGELSLEELHQKILKQYYIAESEVEETEVALSVSDLIEVYDGAIDSFYTVEPLIEMLEVYISGIGGEYPLAINEIDGIFGVGIASLLERYKTLPLESLDLTKLDKVADMIIENNQQKFTTFKVEFNSWESEYNRTSLDIDGVVYYFLIDENGKVRKHNNFVEVDLREVVMGATHLDIKGGTEKNDKV